MKSPLWKHISLIIIAIIITGSIVSISPAILRRFSGPAEGVRAEYPVGGIDLSHHNKKIDLSGVVSDSLCFIYIKTSEGIGFFDPAFEQTYNDAVDNNLKTGAYHYFRFDEPGRLQAIYFLLTLKGFVLDLPLAIDIEEDGNAKGISDEEIVSNLRSMVDYLKDEEYPVVLYSNWKGYKQWIENRFDDCMLWICTFIKPDTGDFTFWQYSHNGKVNGIQGDVDLNVFNGSLKAFNDSVENWNCTIH